MKTKVIITLVVSILLMTVTLALRSNKRTVEENVYRPDAKRKILVQACTVSMKPLNKLFTYTGTFEPYREVMVVPQISGEVVGVYFNEGDYVHKGKRLVQLDDELLQVQYVAAKTSFEVAGRNIERYTGASAGGGVSEIQLDNYRLAFRNAESQLKQLDKQIRMSRIEAPFSGIVTLRDVEIGSIASRNPLARITDLTKVKLEIDVPEREVALFREGESAYVTTDLYPGVVFTGKIAYVSSRADNAHNYEVKILVDNSKSSQLLKAGMYGTASLGKLLNGAALSVPRTALLGSAKNPQVFLIENSRVKLQRIQVGQRTDDAIEVISGIKAGDIVVTTGHINLSEGSYVTLAANQDQN